MSNRYIGGLITKSPTVPTTSAAPGIWTLDQALYYIKAGTWPQPPTYIEDVFSTYLYTGNGSAQTITNGIDLAGKGGLVWIKSRDSGVYHNLVDTARGNTSYIYSNATDVADILSTRVTSFNSNGFTLGPTVGTNPLSNNGVNYVSWSFREAPKFFDVVTYTGNGTSGGSTRTLSHNLGVAPGMVIIKCTTTGYAWVVWHRSVAGNGYLNSTAAFADDGFGITVTSTTVSFGAGNGAVNANGDQYVMYLFAHDTSSSGLIQCGSFSASGSTTRDVTLGWEPQWVMIKASSRIGDWEIVDNMRGIPASSTPQANQEARRLYANNTLSEGNGNTAGISATGFQARNLDTSATYAYMAIRRGPMAVPTVGTSVFNPTAGTGSASTIVTTGFSVDLLLARDRTNGNSTFAIDRLRGISSTSSTTATWLRTDLTDAENNSSNFPTFFNNTGFTRGINWGSANMAFWSFRRAPSFFDEVCYTGNGNTYGGGVGNTISHNLGVQPELIIVKSRSAVANWPVMSLIAYASAAGDAAGNYGDLRLNTNEFVWNGSTGIGQRSYGVTGNPVPAAITASSFVVSGNNTNASGTTYVAYLFASCPGVSKVGTYTGTGALQTINCGFTTGARFVLIKRTDSTGSWYVWDSARGISSGNDPYLLLNSTAAEVTNTNYVDTTSVGFQVTAAAPAELNANGGTYIFLAVA